MVYKLCYVDGNKAYFTSNWKEQWGDDWNDRPYEHNAGEPYRHYWKDGKEYDIPLKECYFELPIYYKAPCDGHLNSPYSVQDINNNCCPWIRCGYDDDLLYIYAGTSYSKFVKTITELGGSVYEPKKRR